MPSHDDTHASLLSAGAALSLGAALGICAPADAADFTVDRLDDPAGAGTCQAAAPNDCSLRQATVNAENSNRPIVDRVLFQAGLSGTISILNQGLIVTEPLGLLGPGADVLTISGGDNGRILFIDEAVGGDPVTVSGLTLTDAYGSGSVGGGAIYSGDAYLTIESSTISNSSAGIADYPGGGIRQVGDQLLIRNSTISGNDAGNGGGVHAFEADVGIQNSTISGNTATGAGGGSGDGYGGGLWLDQGAAGGSLLVYGSTIAGNHAYDGGGMTVAAATNGLASTVIADNTATAPIPSLDLRSAGPDPFKLAFTLVESTAGASIVDIPLYTGSNILGVDPQLGPLAANGGSTRTHRPALSSPLLDKGLTAGAPRDQRNLPRPFDVPGIGNSAVAAGDAADIGAVELQASDFGSSAPPTTAPIPATPPKPTSKKCKKAKKKKCKRKKKRKKRRRK